MYQGNFAINMDAKGRLAIPTKVRETLQSDCGGSIVVTANTTEKCLLVYPEPRWQQKLPEIKNLSSTNKRAARIKRVVLGYATALEVDEGNGRVLIPPTLREYAGLEKKIVLVGQVDYLELWSEENWQSYLDEEDDDEEMPASLSEFSF
ncbi:division/cell wall cluster transcriptional repressor MraZ [Dasania marina]|uniref:division/cell wall cluster transcriptional repressor MraZ n=1 Tax=Dasania marina TaxID=471499 RepID=UPI0030D9D947